MSILRDYIYCISSLILVYLYYISFGSMEYFLFSWRYSINIFISCYVLIWFLIVAYSLWHCYYKFLYTFSCIKFFFKAFTKNSTRPTLIYANDNERYWLNRTSKLEKSVYSGNTYSKQLSIYDSWIFTVWWAFFKHSSSDVLSIFLYRIL